ncbi:glutathione S-transferase (macronuclear) [Tetrahymena thermophila SB210]|uniref:Glutathione S-transferase n=1 Tax=Tetrahymena thermophila (strain SB210) TaxID=312017 RepID=I7MH36_TETTS|nr:glutathione S-transferase [Tetrahymena thermophila SB210]EAS02464.1 glutathione S-transferase [Tetrahymena thermophila SB210]|eukprot:XP_001022709.1 glutathione S-transferase [Tetrahymena thermophila SB210]
MSIKNLSQLNYEIFMDWGSQPSRAVMTVVYFLKIPHKINEVRILKKQNVSEQYKKINPDQKIPCIIDNENFFLNESHSIMRYFCQLYGDNQLYPDDNLKKRALIDSYLDWHHSNTRKMHRMLFKKLFEPQLGIQTSINIEELESDVQKALAFIENNYLNHKNKFFFGFDNYTLADISAYCELYQSKVVNYSFQPYPNILEWMSKMQQINEIKQTHKVYDELLNKRIQKQSSKL